MAKLHVDFDHTNMQNNYRSAPPAPFCPPPPPAFFFFFFFGCQFFSEGKFLDPRLNFITFSSPISSILVPIHQEDIHLSHYWQFSPKFPPHHTENGQSLLFPPIRKLVSTSSADVIWYIPERKVWVQRSSTQVNLLRICEVIDYFIVPLHLCISSAGKFIFRYTKAGLFIFTRKIVFEKHKKGDVDWFRREAGQEFLYDFFHIFADYRIQCTC